MPTTSDRRLHPASPVFVLVENLKQFIVPLIILFFTGSGDRGDKNDFIALGIMVLISLHSVLTYFTFRFRIDDTGVVIHSGVFIKSVRNIPFARIQNVSLKQTMLHRMAGVADVELESAGGAKAEGRMRVLSLADARDLEATIREHGRGVATGVAAGLASASQVPSSQAELVPPRTLLTLDLRELARLGVISNRGMVVAAATLGVFLQYSSDRVGSVVERGATAMFGWTETVNAGVAFAFVLVVVLSGLALLTAMSIAFAVTKYFEFKLTDDGRRLRVERGMFTRVRGALHRRRIQAYTIREGVIQRWFKRRSLHVDSAGATADQDRSVRELIPIATPAVVDDLVAQLLASPAVWPVSDWRALHPRAWRRVMVRPVVFVLLLTVVAVVALDMRGLWMLLALPLTYVRARVWARYAAYTNDGGIVGVRNGWLSRSWRFADARKLQVLAVTQSYFDRRHGMATLVLDTAGQVATERALRIRFLAEGDARALRDRLAVVVSPK